MPFAHLPALDVAIVLVYFSATILLGAWFSRRQRDTRTYFVGDRNVGMWLVLASIVATETSTVTFLSVPGLAFKDGGNLSFLQLAVGYIVGRCLIAWLFLPQYIEGELLTAYQLLRRRFNPAVQRTASSIFLVTRTLADGMRLFLTALLLKQFAGWDITLSILVMGVATIIYTYLGGMEAVIWTDLIQLVVYILGALVAAAFILSRVDGGWEGFITAGSDAGKFVLFDFTLDQTRAFNFWAGLIGGAFFTMASHGADQLMVQRYLCARSLRSARTALVGSGFVVLAQFLLFLVIGVGLFVLCEQRELILPAEVRDRADEVFGFFIVNYLPVGVVGLLIAAVLSAAMSTLSSSLNSSASAVVNDFYRPLRPGHAERHYLIVSRGMTTAWGVAQMGVALVAAATLERSVVEMVLSIAGFTTGMVLGLFFLGRMKRPVRSGSALTGLVLGFAAVLAIKLGTSIAWPWYAPIGTLVTVASALALDGSVLLHGSPSDRSAESGIGRTG